MSDPTPSLAWDDPKGFGGNVIWMTRLDDRFHIEVSRDRDQPAYDGWLRVWDHEQGDKFIFEKEVRMSFQALFGPDVADVALWQDMVVDFVDKEYLGEADVPQTAKDAEGQSAPPVDDAEPVQHDGGQEDADRGGPAS